MSAGDVLVTVRFFDEAARDAIRQQGFRIRDGGVAFDGVDAAISEEMHAALEKSSAWILGIAPVTREVLQRYPHLKIVARRGVGYDTIDASAIKDLGRVLTITPGSNEPTVADHAVGLMLAVGKRFSESHRRMQAGEKAVVVGTELYSKTVGLLGFGRIAQLVAKRLMGFDARVLVHDPFVGSSLARDAGVELVSLDELLRSSDFLSLHAPLTADTRHLINSRTIELMKPGAILINTARGELVDDAALVAALSAGRIRGAGLDVLGSERDKSLAPMTDQLLAFPNVLCTQHTAGSSDDGLARANMLAAECVIAALQGTPVPAKCIVADGRLEPSASS